MSHSRVQGRGARLTVAAVMAGALGIIALPGQALAAAGVPVFPDNLVGFPTGISSPLNFRDHVGERATIEVTRPGVGVIGSAVAMVA